MVRLYSICALLSLSAGASAHVAAWARGMYCLNGTTPGVNEDSRLVGEPLYHMTRADWWMQAHSKCVNFPPAPGDFLELPANGEFKVELATSRHFTTLGGPSKPEVGKFPGSIHVPEAQFGTDGKCITDPNIHTFNESTAAGTAFAIAYTTSDPMAVKANELVVFTVKHHTPWYREVTYEVPNLPACPKDGCVCAWGWVPNGGPGGCGQPNMYMQPFRCKVTGKTGPKRINFGTAPKFCEDDQSKCVKGAKQMIYFNQLEGNNVEYDGSKGTPTYNARMGFYEGRQTDIFVS